MVDVMRGGQHAMRLYGDKSDGTHEGKMSGLDPVVGMLGESPVLLRRNGLIAFYLCTYLRNHGPRI